MGVNQDLREKFNIAIARKLTGRSMVDSHVSAVVRLTGKTNIYRDYCLLTEQTHKGEMDKTLSGCYTEATQVPLGRI